MELADEIEETAESTSPSLCGLTFGSAFRSSWLLLWGIAVPTAFLVAATTFKPFQFWQSGQVGDYAILVFNWPSVLPLYPLLLFSAVGLGWTVWCDQTGRTRPWVRFALATGLVAWLELWLAWFAGTDRTFDPGAGLIFTVLAPIVGVIAAYLFAAIRYSVFHWRDRKVRGWLIVTAVLVILVTLPCVASIRNGDDVEELLGGVFVSSLALMVFAAPLAVATYGWCVYECWRSAKGEPRRYSLKWLMWIAAWFSANLAAWRLAIDSAMAKYAELPTEPPSRCFIATAAAGGHRRFVGACEAGVNHQLRTLKAGEIILHVTMPRLHARLRWVYNRLGPRAATLVANRWLADLAFVGLKPFEWFAKLLLLAAGVPASRVHRLYR